MRASFSPDVDSLSQDLCQNTCHSQPAGIVLEKLQFADSFPALHESSRILAGQNPCEEGLP